MRSFPITLTLLASLALGMALTGCTVIESDGTDTGANEITYEDPSAGNLGNGGNTGGQNNGNQNGNGGGQGNNDQGYDDPDTGYDGSTDADVDGGSNITCYPDDDNDGYGDANWPEEFEGDECPYGWADNGNDACNGNDEAHEYCDCFPEECDDGSDDSTDTGYDEDDGSTVTCFPDLDHDGHGNGAGDEDGYYYDEVFAGTECPYGWAEKHDDWCDGNPDAFDYCGCMPEECE